MLLNEAKVHEATGKVAFASLERRREHVLKHVFEGRDERWHAVVGTEELERAREELAAGKYGRSCERMEERYENLLSRALVHACAQGRWHLHEVHLQPDLTSRPPLLMVKDQVIDAWCPHDGLLIVARAVVTTRGFSPYSLSTGYRPWPKIGPAAFARKCLERRLARESVSPTKVLAVHDRGVSP